MHSLVISISPPPPPLHSYGSVLSLAVCGEIKNWPIPVNADRIAEMFSDCPPIDLGVLGNFLIDLVVIA